MITKNDRLESVIAALQNRYGTRSIRQGSAVLSVAQTISTGFKALDALLLGGVPVGEMTELSGQGTCGVVTVGHSLLASAQAAGRQAAVIDVSHTFSPHDASSCGVAVERLLLVRPCWPDETFGIATDLIRGGGVGMLVIDMPAFSTGQFAHDRSRVTNLKALSHQIRRSDCAVALLTPVYVGRPAGDGSQGKHVFLRVMLRRTRWLYQHQRLVGFESLAQVTKHRLTAPGKSAYLHINLKRME